MNNQDLENLLARTYLRADFGDFLKEVIKQYPNIGQIIKYEPIVEGYEDANILLFTTSGKYILKIFNKTRTYQNILWYIHVISDSRINGVPVPEFIKARKSQTGRYCPEEGEPTYFCIIKFFEGKSFTNVKPTLSEMVKIAGYLAKINDLDYDVVLCYDSWGNRNLYREYEANFENYAGKHSDIIEKTAVAVHDIDLSLLKKGLIHGDMKRTHVLKNEKGEFCIIDFGCMRIDGLVFDLSTYLAWFCLGEDTWSKRKEILSWVVTEYTKTQPLSEYEKNLLPMLIRAAYVSYFFRTSILIRQGDHSAEVELWNKKSETMLEMSFSNN